MFGAQVKMSSDSRAHLWGEFGNIRTPTLVEIPRLKFHENLRRIWLWRAKSHAP